MIISVDEPSGLGVSNDGVGRRLLPNNPNPLANFTAETSIDCLNPCKLEPLCLGKVSGAFEVQPAAVSWRWTNGYFTLKYLPGYIFRNVPG